VRKAPARSLRAFAVSPPGFEDLVAEELRAFGVPARETEGGAAFEGGWAEIYRANLRSRVASRILVRVAEFPAERFEALEEELSRVVWAEWLPPKSRLTIRVARRGTRLYHTGKLWDVAARALRTSAGAEVERGAKDPSFGLYLRVQGPSVTVSLDTSGDHLHKRGYRKEPGTAPLRENLAAGLLKRARWSGEEPLLDPFCGTGTFAVEAAWLALGVAPGRLRSFAFQALPSFEPAVWAEVRDGADASARATLPAPIFAADRDPGALSATVSAAKRAGLAGELQVALCDFSELAPPSEAGLVVTNPPYGRRLHNEEAAYHALGRALRRPFHRWRWAVVVPRQPLERALGVPVSERHSFRNGGLPLWLALGGPAEAENRGLS
jgi:putative N6-adenine-specific DNA methylase